MANDFQLSGKVVLDDSQAKGSVKTLKSQLKEATTELQNVVAQFGSMSDEAANAARRVAELKDEIGDAAALAEAFSPEAKFNAFAGAIQGVVGGFAAVQGAMAVFGGESEAVEQTLKKVQGALALSQGLNTVMESIDAFKNLNAVLQQNTIIQRVLNFVMQGQFKTNAQLTASKEADVVATNTQTAAQVGLTAATNVGRIAMIALRGAIMATGIGALVVGVIALVGAVADWVSGEDEAKAAMEAANKAMEDTIALGDRRVKQIEEEGKLNKLRAEVAGKSEKELYNIEQKTQEDKIKALQDTYNTLNKQTNDYYNSLPDKVSKEENETLTKMYEARKKAYAEIESAQRQFTENQLNEQKRLNQLSLQADAELLSLQQSNALDGIKDSDKRGKQKAQQDYDNAVAALKLKQYSAEQEAAIMKELENRKNLQIDAINDAAYEKRKAKNKENSDKAIAQQKELDALYFDAKKSKMTEQQIAEAELERKYQENIKKLKTLGGKDQALLDEAYQIEKKKISDKYKNEDIAKEQAFQKQLADIITTTRIAGIKDENEKARQEKLYDYQQQYAEIDANEKLTAQQKLELKKALKLKEAQELALIDQQIKQQQSNDKIAEYDAIIQDSTISFSLRKQAIDQEQAYIKQAKEQGFLTDKEYTDKEKELAKARKDIGDAEVQAKEQQLTQIAGALNALSQLAGENTAVGKALAIAGTAISTYQAAQKAYQSAFMPVPTPASPALGAVFAGIAVAQGLANIKKIVSTKIPGVSGNKGGTPSMPSAASVTPPLPPQVGSTMINQGQVNQMVTANATARAYVVESDMTNSQERIERINRAARIN